MTATKIAIAALFTDAPVPERSRNVDFRADCDEMSFPLLVEWVIIVVIDANPVTWVEGQSTWCGGIHSGEVVVMARSSGGCRVSELAAEFNVNPRTIRYYERIGLLSASTRTAAGYRLFSPGDRDRLRFILKAKAIGLTLGEIREVLSLRRGGVVPCRRVLGLIEAKLEHIDRHVQALLEFRDELVGVQREAADGDIDGCVCGLIEEHEPHHEPEALRLATEVLSHRPVRARQTAGHASRSPL